MSAQNIPFAAIDNHVEILHQSVGKVAAWHRNNSHLSEEGKAESFKKAVDSKNHRFRERAEKLAATIEQIAPAMQARVESTRGHHFPQAGDATEQLAAELKAQRIMSRPDFNQSKFLEMFKDSEPSPARTIIAEELTARGKLDPQAVEGTLQQIDPEYGAALHEQGIAQAYAGVLSKKLEAATRQLDTLHPVEIPASASQSLADLHRDGYPVGVEIEPPAGAFNEITVDAVYRAE